jgi:hypothetical protein
MGANRGKGYGRVPQFKIDLAEAVRVTRRSATELLIKALRETRLQGASSYSTKVVQSCGSKVRAQAPIILLPI